MCRAVWLLIAAVDDHACKRLRRAAGAEVQVIAMETSAEAALGVPGDNLDAAVVDARLDGAGNLASALTARGVAVVVVREPGSLDGDGVFVDWDGEIDDALPGAITRALIARRRAGA